MPIRLSKRLLKNPKHAPQNHIRSYQHHGSASFAILHLRHSSIYFPPYNLSIDIPIPKCYNMVNLYRKEETYG